MLYEKSLLIVAFVFQKHYEMHVQKIFDFILYIIISLNQFRLQTHNFGYISVALMQNHHSIVLQKSLS